MTLGQMIKKLRKTRFLSQQELAKETGIHQAQISEYESGKFEPREENLKKIAKALKVDPQKLALYYDSDI